MNLNLPRHIQAWLDSAKSNEVREVWQLPDQPWVWQRRIIVCAILLLLAGCTPAKQIVKPEVVTVPVEIRTRIPDAYLTDRGVAEPEPLCRLAGPPPLVVFCNDQVAMLVDSYRAALRQSNADKAAIRLLQPTETQP